MDYAEYAIKETIYKNIHCIGLHVNLTVGKLIIQNSHLTDEEGVFLYNQRQIDNPRLTYDNEDINDYKCPDILYKDFTIKNVNINCLKDMILK